MTVTSRSFTALALLAALGGLGSLAQAQNYSPPNSPQQEIGRVISSTPITEQNRTVGYSVTYEYAGRHYTTRTDSPPGTTIPVQVSTYGVYTTPVPPPDALAPQPLTNSTRSANSASQAPWQNVVPEPGIVVSANSAPAPVYAAPPAYVQPMYPAPVYVQPAYAYPQPFFYPPVGISLGIGYSRGWGGGGWGYRGHGWRGHHDWRR